MPFNKTVVDQIIEQAQSNGKNLIGLVPELSIGPPVVEGLNLGAAGVAAGRLQHSYLKHEVNLQKAL